MIGLIFQGGLFLWFIFSLYIVGVDHTLSWKIKIIGEIINLLCLGYIAANATQNNQSFSFFIVGFALLAWFFYWTPQDLLNPGYSVLEKIVYGTVDVCMILFLSMSLWFAFCPISILSSENSQNPPSIQFFKIFSSVV